MYTIRYALVSVLLFFFGLSKVEGQITDVDFLIKYNPETCLYEACIIIVGGSATTFPQRIQFNAQYTIVVPTGTNLSIDSLFWPKENNATYTGTIPCLWEFSSQEISPPTQPQNDFYSISPNLSPPSAYNNLMPGDTVRLFGLGTDAPLTCEMEIRPFECGVDPSSLDMPSGGDFCCGFTIGSGTQLYRMNRDTEHPPFPEIEYDIECNGDVTINVTPLDSFMCQHPYDYLWTGPFGSGFSSTSESPVIPAPVTPGLYEAYIMDSYGCDTTIYIQVDGVPNVTADETICGAGTVQLEDLSGSGMGTWSLDPSNTVGAFVGSTSFGTATATFFANATGTYTFIYSGGGCDAETMITVAASTDVPNVSNNGPLCEGDELILSTDFISGATYAWTGPLGFSSSQQNPTISNVTLAHAGDYTIIVTNGSCPSMPATTNVVVNDKPSTPIASNNGPLCEGDDINLSTDFVPGASYSWTGPSGYTSNQQNPIISGATSSDAGQYCVIVTVNGCPSDQGCTDVVINPIPATPTASNNGPLCEGDDINLSTDFVPGASYSWTGPSGYTSNQQNPIISGATSSDAGQYCVIVTVNGCPSDQGCTDVVINPIPAAPTASNNGPLCEGDDLNLSTDFVSGASYAWTGPFGYTSNQQNPIISGVTSSDAGQYCVIVTVNGCPSDLGCTDVVINPIPSTPIASNNGPLCEGDDLNLSTDFVPGASYAWTGPFGYTSNQQNPIISGVTSSDAGQYCVVITENGCSSLQGCTDVIINNTPSIPVVTSNSALCEGETLMLDGPNIPGASYTWRDPNNIFFSAVEDPSIPNITPAEAGMYCLVVTVNGCDSEAGCTEVIVNPTPTPPIVTSNSPICPGEDIELFTDAVPGAIYTWTGPAPSSIISNDEDAIYAGASAIAGTYCLVVTVNGCDSEVTCTDVTIKTTPSAPNISSNTPLCEGNNLQLTADPVIGADYQWSGPNGFVSTDQNPIISNITAANDGIYTLIITVDGCASSSITTNVDIFPTPVEPIPTNNGPICEGEDLMLAVDEVPGATYIWSSTNGFSSFSQNPIIAGATASDAGTYCVVISLNGCDSSPGCIDVIVKPTPATPTANNNGPICEGEDINLTTAAVAGATYAWTGPGGYTSTQQNPIIAGASPSDNGSYCVIVTVDGCVSLSGCSDVEVKPTPATPVASYNGPICEGEDINLTTDAVAGATYAWTGPGGYTSTQQNPIIAGASPSDNGSYCVIVTLDGCVSLSGCTDVEVKPTPATPTANNNGPICEGEDINLTTAAVVGATYAWTGPGGYTSTQQNPVIAGASPSDNGSYCVIVTVDGCVSLSGCTDVEVKPTPATPVASNNGPICEGEDINLTTAAVVGATYAWTGPGGYTSTQQNPIIAGASPSDNGSYCVIVTVDGCVSLSGCSDVEVKPTPATPVASNNGPICEGEDINLTTDAVVGATYAWTGPGGYTSTQQNPIIAGASPSDNGSYCVIVTVDGCVSLSGCSDVEVKPTPATPVASYNGPICEGEDINLTTDAVAGATYAWTGPGGYTSTQQNPIIAGASPSDNGSYCVIVTVDGCVSLSGCSDVEVKPTPATPVASNNGPICEGEDVNLTTAAVVGATYAWTGPGGYTSDQQNPIIAGASPSDNGSYCVIVTVDGCVSLSGCSDVEVKPTPATPVASNNGPICEGEDINLTTAAVVGATYAWTGPGGYTSDQQNPIIAGASPSDNGSYCVIVTVDGCVSLSGCSDVEVKPTPATPVASNNGPICEGEDINLTTAAVVGATYAWTGPGGYTSDQQNPIIAGASPSDNGSYCVIVTLDGCVSLSGCTDVEVKPTPATPVANNNGPICEGEDINLTTAAVVGATYAWTGPGGYTSDQQNPIIAGASPSDNGSYCVIVTLDGCVSLSGCTDVEVKPTPATPTVNNNGPICEGEDINLTTAAVAGATYAWTGPGGYTSTQQNPIIAGASPSDNGSYCVIVTLDGCVSLSGCSDVEVKPTPATPVASNNGPICEGEDINLTTAAVAGATYAWTGPGGYTSTQQNPIIAGASPSDNGSYCVIVTVDGCVSAQGCTNVTVKPTPATPFAFNNGPICEGEDIELSTDAVSGASYAWTGPLGFSSTQQNPSIAGASPSNNGDYCVIVTVDGCVSAQGCTNVTVKPTPATPFAFNNGPICEGEDIELSTDAVSGASYAWTGPLGFSSTQQNPSIAGASPSNNGDYCVIVTVDGCVSAQGCTNVTVKPTPSTPTASNNGPICEGEDIELSTDAVSGASYDWTGPLGFSSTQQNPSIAGASPSNNGDYCVIVTVDGCVSAQGCTNVTVKPTPSTPTASNNGPICEGEDIELSTDAVAGASYAWTGPLGFSSTQQNPSIVGASPSNNGDYCVIVTVDGCVSAQGCTNVTVKPTPSTPTASNNGPICEGEDIELSTDAVSGASYAWTGPLGFSSTQQNPSIVGASPSNNGDYCVIVTVDGCVSAQGCTNVTVKPTPSTPTASNNGPICEGEDIELSTAAVVGASYAWTGPLGFSSTQQNPSIAGASPSNNGDYCVIVTVDGCVSTQGCTNVTVKPTPSTPTASNNGPICEGEDIELSTEAVSGASYAWTGPLGFSSTQQNPSIAGASPSNNGDYCVIVTVDGCVSAQGCTNVTVKPTPSTPTASNNGPICEGEDIELSTAAVVGASYAWTGPLGFSSTQQNPSIVGASPSNNGDYCVIVTVDGCVSAQGCTNVTVKPTPSTPTASNNGPICEGEDIELSTDAVSGASYAWTGPLGFSSTQQNPSIAGASPSNNGSYCVIVTVDGCVSAQGCTNVTVKPTPSTPTASNNGPICEGEDIELSTAAVVGATYAWTGPLGFSSTQQNPSIVGASPSNNGDYCVIVTVDGCVSAQGCTNVTVKPTPSTPTASNNGPICEGEDIELSTDAVSGASYSWTGPLGFSSTQQNPSIAGASPSNNGDYCVIVTVDGCVSAQGCTNVTVKPTPSTPTASNNGPICEGEDIELSTDAVSGASYSWTGPLGFSSTQQNPSIAGASPSNNGDYCVIVTVDGCVSAQGCTNVTVKPTPSTPTASNNGPICEGEDIELSTDAVSGASYSWTGPLGFSSTQQNPSIAGASPSNNGDYCVIVTVDGCVSAQGCTNVNVKPTPSTPTASNNGPICEDGNLELYASSIPGAIYSWSGPNSFTSNIQNPIIIGATPLDNGSYCVEVIVNGCVSEESCTTIEVNPTPENPTPSNNGPICEGENIELTSGDVSGASYSWTGPNGFVSNEQNPIINEASISNNGTYCVVIEMNGCVSVSECTDVIIKLNPVTPLANNNGPICEGENAQLSTSDVAGASYSWTGPNGYTSNEQNPILVAATSSESGTYCVVVTRDGCVSEAGCTDVEVSPAITAGEDQSFLCVVLSEVEITMDASATSNGSWSAGSNPASVSFADINSSTTTITNITKVGTYAFIWRNGICSDTVEIEITQKPNAGPDQFVKCNLIGSAIMAAQGINGIWSLGTAAGNVNIVDSTDRNTAITNFENPGIYELIWTIDGCSDTVTIEVDDDCECPIANNVIDGNSDDYCGESIEILIEGEEATPSGGIYKWQYNDGFGFVDLASANSKNYTTPALAVGTHTFRRIYSIDSPICSDTSNQLIINVLDQPNAGDDQTLLCQDLSSLEVVMDGTGPGNWNLISGAGSATIVNNNIPGTIIREFTSAGTYIFSYENDICSDEVEITITEAAFAGPDQSVECFVTGSVVMNAVANSNGSWSWGATPQGDQPVFDILDANATISGFASEGDYILIWTVGDCSDNATITVGQNCSCPIDNNDINQPNPSQFCGESGIIDLTGSMATPDGEYLWEYSFNSGSWDSAENTNSLQNYTTDNLAVGNHRFRRIYETTSAPICSDTSNIIEINVLDQPDAGEDQTLGCIELPGGSVEMNGSAVGTWSVLTTNLGSANIVNTDLLNTTINGFSAAGTYGFVLTNGICKDTVYVEVSESIDAGPDRTVNCYVTGNAVMAATSGNGIWSVGFVPPGASAPNIVSEGSPNTSVDDFDLPGTYQLIWTDNISNCTDEALIVVGEDCACPISGNNLIQPIPSDFCDISPMILIEGADASPVGGTYGWEQSTDGVLYTSADGFNDDRDYTTGALIAGMHYFRRIYSIETPMCSDTSNNVIINVIETPDAGLDQFLECITLPGSTIMAASGTGIWTANIGNPSIVTIIDNDSPTTTIEGFAAAGEYFFTYANGNCADEVKVTVSKEADAGSDQSVNCFLTGTASLSASGSGTWSYGNTTNGDQPAFTMTNANTTISGFAGFGTYELIWTSNGCSDTILITVGDDCSCPIGNNLITQPDPEEFCLESEDVSIIGSVASPSGGAYIWEHSTDGTIFGSADGINDGQNYSTGFLGIGEHFFRRIYDLESPDCSDTSNVVTIVVYSQPNAGVDQIFNCIEVPASITMAGTGPGVWTPNTGNPSMVTISPPSSATTIITGLGSGDYFFTFTNSICSDEVMISITAESNAGEDQSFDCFETATAVMNASGTGTWSWGVTPNNDQPVFDFSKPNALITGFLFEGNYELIWTNVDGCEDSMVILIGAICDCPIANNIIDQPDPNSFCELSTEVIISGSDAAPPGGTYSWEHSIDGVVYAIADGIPNNRNYTTGQLSIGVHRFRRIYTVTDPIACEDISNTVTIEVFEGVQAGPDQSLDCFEDGEATMSATGSGTWTWISSDVALINGTSNPNATINNFPQAGTYELLWTSDDGGCTDAVTIVVGENCLCPIENNEITQPDPSEFCGVSDLVTILGTDALPTGGTYAWELDSGSGFIPANGIKNTRDYTTEALAVGVHRFRRIYTVTDPIACEDISNVVTIEVFEDADAGPDQSVECFEDDEATMAATGSGSWTWVSSDVALINGTTNPNAIINNFPQAGTYELMWTTDDGCTDAVTIVVGENCLCPIENNIITQPDPNEFCGVSDLVTILGTDALPTGGTYAWEQDSGSGFIPANGIKNNKDYTTEALAVGVHRFRRIYTVTDPIACEDISNVVTIEVFEDADAGPDQSVECFEDDEATMAATGSGSWTWVSSDVALINGTTNPNAIINNFPQAGTYELMWTTDDGCTDAVTIVVGENCACPIENNIITQPDPNEFCGVSDLVTILGTDALPAGGTYSWEYDNGSGFIAANGIKDERDYTTEALAVGVHRFRRIYTVTDPIACEDISNIVTIEVFEDADAGPDQSVDCYEDGEVTMAAFGSGAWSWISTETADIDSSNPNTIVSNFPQAGTYELMWTTAVGCTDVVLIVVGDNCACPIENNEITQPAPNEFCGVSDLVTILGSEALPAGGTYSWEYDNGSGFIAANGIKDERDYTTEALAVGVHRFRRIYTVTDPIACEDFSNIVTIEVFEDADAGPDQSVDCYEDGEVTMAASGSGAWSWISTETADIDPSNPNTIVSNFPQAGTYELMWTTADGCTDVVSIVVGDNCACPIENNEITQPDPSEFCGVSDLVTILGSEALPAGGTYSWEYDNGSGFIAANGIKDERDYTTEALAVGVHRFRRIYTVTDPIACEDISNIVTIEVFEEADAGPDQSLDCYEDGEVTMAASGSGAWSWISTETADIDPSNPNTIVSNFPQAGTYELMWTTAAGCTNVVSIVVGDNCACPIENNEITQPDPSEFCGVSDLVTILGSEALPAGGTYSWEYDNGSGFIAANGIKDERDYTTEALAVGVHRFRRIYTVTDPIACEDISNIVTIEVFEEADAGPDQSVDCFEDGEVTMAASGSGAWSWISTETADIDPSNPNTIVSNFPQAGTYELMWTTAVGCTDVVLIVVGDNCACPIENNEITQPDPSEFCGVSDLVTILGSEALPAGGTYSWQYDNGSGFIAANGIKDERDYTTEALAVGVHRFRRIYTVTDPIACEDISNIVTIEVFEDADAGPEQSVDCYEDGEVTMAASGSGAWSWISTETADIDPSNPNTIVSNFPQAGTYELMWTTADGCTDVVSIVVGDNCACPIENNEITQPDPSEFCGVSDLVTILGTDALPAGGTYSWEYDNGSGFIAANGIKDERDYTTEALAVGVHRFRRIYTVTDPIACEDISNIVEINVLELLEAGENQNLGCVILEDVTVKMNAEGDGTWIQHTSNPGQVIFSDDKEAKAICTGFIAPGTYTFIWSNGTCEDEVSFYLEETKDGGEDQFVSCFIDGMATLNAEGIGTWTAGINNPGTVTFSSFTDPKATLTNFSIDGVYEFIWTVNGCDDSVLVQVNDECPCLVESNSIIDDVSNIFCKTTGDLLIVGNAASPAGGDYFWQMSINGSGFSKAPGTNNGKDYDASNLSEGDYKIRRLYTLNIDGVECDNISDEITFYVFDKKQDPGEINFTPNPVCAGDSLILEVEFNHDLTYNWQIMSGGRVLYSLDSMSMILVETPGTITVSVTQSLEGCDNNLVSTSSEIEITVLDTPKPNLGRDTTFCELDETFFIYPGDFEEYEWHDGSTEESFEVDGQGIYSVSVMDTMGCVGTDMVNIKSFCCEFAYPNIFKADSRGENSEFKVTDIYNCVIEGELFIYDRWGNLVFIGNELDAWDGTFNGKFVEQGVYVFIFKYKAMDADRAEFEDQVSGDITVIR